MSGFKTDFYRSGRVELCSLIHGKAGALSFALRGLVKVVKSLVLSVAPLVVALGGFTRFIITSVIMNPKALGGLGSYLSPFRGGDMNLPCANGAFAEAGQVHNVNPARASGLVDMPGVCVNPPPEGAA